MTGMRGLDRDLRVSILIALSCTLGGCRRAQPPVTASVISGMYSYVSEDPESRPTDHNLNRLILRSDGTYDLVEGGTTKAVSEKKGLWTMQPGNPPDHVDVVLDHSSYPIKMKRNEVRLLVDLDVGIWWVKSR
jgi:hypothetical protein